MGVFIKRYSFHMSRKNANIRYQIILVILLECLLSTDCKVSS